MDWVRCLMVQLETVTPIQSSNLIRVIVRKLTAELFASYI